MMYELEHRGDGNFRLPANEMEEIGTVVKCILTTVPGQHPRLPEFGNHSMPVVFDNPGDEMEDQIEGFLKYDIERWEPRVKIGNVNTTFDYDRGKYIADIPWTVPGRGIEVARRISQAIGG